ncbi:MAG: formylglycine-generating enzyme family protein, partial [Planctomycetota bacterium]|nr:formylglycine-generating enzyme family protein [Planctomycetota bacterium]
AQRLAAERLNIPVQYQNDLGMRFMLIPPGTFQMGSPPGELERDEGEIQHGVRLTRPFYLMTAEVSNAQLRRYHADHVSESPPGMAGFNDPDKPATSVGWENAGRFCNWLSQRDTHYEYRLPTEAEWEYACRAGSTERFPWGEDERLAAQRANTADATARADMGEGLRTEAEALERWRWFEGRDGHWGPSPVGSFKPNAWGLYDLIGNVHEWCADRAGPYDTAQVDDPQGPMRGELRVLRGGAADSPVHKCRAAWRGGMYPIRHAPNLGFRVVATPR